MLGVPLAIRVKSARTDRHITRELRSLRFGTTIPGGYSSCEFALHRPLGVEADDLVEFADVYVYDTRSGAVVWQGKLEDPGRTAGAEGEIWAVAAVGPAARAHDRTVPLIYVDRNQERYVRYTEANTNRSGITEPGETSAETPYLKCHAPRGTSWAAGDVIGWAYRGLKDAGLKLGWVSYTWDAGETDSDWRVQYAVVEGAVRTQLGNQGFDTGGGSNSGVITTQWASGPDILELRIARTNSTETVPGDADWAIFANISVAGLRLTATGAEDTTAANYADHVHAEQVIADLLGRLLTMYDGASASIATSSFEIEQFAFPDGASPHQVLEALVEIHKDHFWAAWEDAPGTTKSRFEWRAWPTTVRYEARAGAGLDSPGSASELFNAVSVRWRDVNGRLKRNRRTQTVQALTDAGLTREALIDLGDERGTSAMADRAGDQFLAEHASAQNDGTLTIRTPIYDRDLGRMVLPHEIVAGHLIRVRDIVPSIDALNRTARDGVSVFRVISTEYSPDDNACRLGLDSMTRSIAQIVGSGSRTPRMARR